MTVYHMALKQLSRGLSNYSTDCKFVWRTFLTRMRNNYLRMIGRYTLPGEVFEQAGNFAGGAAAPPSRNAPRPQLPAYIIELSALKAKSNT